MIMGRMVQSKTQSTDAKFDIFRNLAKEKKPSSVVGGAFSTPLMPSSAEEDDKKRRGDLTKVALAVSFEVATAVLGRVKIEGRPKATVGVTSNNTRRAAKERLLKDNMVKNGMGRLPNYEEHRRFLEWREVQQSFTSATCLSRHG